MHSFEIDVALPNLLVELVGGFRPVLAGGTILDCSVFLTGCGLLFEDDAFLLLNNFNFNIPPEFSDSVFVVVVLIVLTDANFGVLTAFGAANLELPIFVVVATRTCCV